MPQNNIFETDSILDIPIVGREADLSRIVNLLASFCHQQALTIIPIVGMGGLGKTTLAKSVCQEVSERKLFDVKIWVYVSYNFDDKRILGEMLQTCNGSMSGKTNKDAILQELEIALSGKKFLLVLDDVWSDASQRWSGLVNRLLRVSGNGGNAIIVTTRSEEVASMVETSSEFRHRLGTLSDDYCWSIMKEKVCRNRGESITSDLETIGVEIAKKCRGVPLAAKVLGGTMCLEMNKEAWLSIRNSNVLNASDDEVTNVESILKLSLDRLPAPVKSCFAYCSVFPKDCWIDKGELVELWMAEGLVEQCNGDTADKYFNALLLNSFFHILEVDEYNNVFSIKYKMHDLVHDLAMSITKSEILISETRSIRDVISHARHLNIICDREAVSKFPKIGAKRLRSLFTNDAVIFKSLQFKSLRTLKFQFADIEELPSAIGNLKHLRYLDVSFTPIKAFPESITKLYNLQTLRFNVCTSLKKLPRGKMSNLISLRHIVFCEDHHMPARVGRLTHLQTLPFFIVGPDGGGSIQELENLNELRGELAIKNLEKVRNREEAEKANLKVKTKLKALRFVWSERRESSSSNVDDYEVLEGLQPHPNIESIKIENYLGETFPFWLLMMRIDGNDFNRLVDVRLKSCTYCDKIPRLGNLPHLKFLEIDGMETVTCIGNEFYGIIGAGSTSSERRLFPALKIFCLQYMSSLVEWRAPPVDEGGDTVAFPCLEELSITQCALLRSIPMINRSSLVKLEIFGCDRLRYLFEELHSFPSLKSLVIAHCSKLTSFPSELQSCTSLEDLTIMGCFGLTSLPEDLGELSSLVSLRLTTGLSYFPHTMLLSLTGLKSLVIGDFNMEWNDLPNLNSIKDLRSLEQLEVYGSADYEKLNYYLPYQLQHLTSLHQLRITLFYGLVTLPEWLGNLSSLRELRIFYCKDLKYLPSVTAMQRLSRLKKFDHNKLSPSQGKLRQGEWLRMVQDFSYPGSQNTMKRIFWILQSIQSSLIHG